MKSSPEGQSCSPGPSVEYSVDSMPDQGSLGKHQPRPCGHIGEEVMSQGQDDKREPQENVCSKALISQEKPRPRERKWPLLVTVEPAPVFLLKTLFHHRLLTCLPQGTPPKYTGTSWILCGSFAIQRCLLRFHFRIIMLRRPTSKRGYTLFSQMVRFSIYSNKRAIYLEIMLWHRCVTAGKSIPQSVQQLAYAHLVWLGLWLYTVVLPNKLFSKC